MNLGQWLGAWVLVSLVSLYFSGCSGPQTIPTAQEMAGRGPVVVNPRSSPKRVEIYDLDQSIGPVEFTAEILDTRAPVTQAQLLIADTGIIVPMVRVGATRWRGSLTPKQIRDLAVNGRDIEYVGRVVAKDQNGTVNMSRDPVLLSIATSPEIAGTS